MGVLSKGQLPISSHDQQKVAGSIENSFSPQNWNQQEQVSAHQDPGLATICFSFLLFNLILKCIKRSHSPILDSKHSTQHIFLPTLLLLYLVYVWVSGLGRIHAHNLPLPLTPSCHPYLPPLDEKLLEVDGDWGRRVISLFFGIVVTCKVTHVSWNGPTSMRTYQQR